MQIDLKQVEDAAKELYIRALKVLPPDIKEGFTGLVKRETNATGQSVLATLKSAAFVPVKLVLEMLSGAVPVLRTVTSRTTEPPTVRVGKSSTAGATTMSASGAAAAPQVAVQGPPASPNS